MWDAKTRGIAVVFYSFAVVGGPTLGRNPLCAFSLLAEYMYRTADRQRCSNQLPRLEMDTLPIYHLLINRLYPHYPICARK